MPAVLRYQYSLVNRKSWPQKSINGNHIESPNGLYGCTRDDFNKELSFYKMELACDEYPFSASMEGGYNNFERGQVSGRFIPSEDNFNFGKVLSSLGRMKKGDYYIVAPLEFAPSSMIINKP